MDDPEVLEISLDPGPKNRRRFLAMKGGDPPMPQPMPGMISPEAVGLPPEGMNPVDRVAREGIPRVPAPAPMPPPTLVVMAEPAAEPAAPEAEPEVSPVSEVEPESPPESQPEPEIDEEVAEVARSACIVALSRTALIPKRVSDAVAYIVSCTNIPVEEQEPVLDDEGQVHIRSLLALIPETAPDNILQAAQVVEQWADAGFPLYGLGAIAASPAEYGYEDEMPQKPMMPDMPAMAPQKRVVDSDQLLAEANRAMRHCIENGDIEQAGAIKAFSNKLKKSLPDGGFVVVSGVVPRSESIPMINLSDLAKGASPDEAKAIQMVVDAACHKEMSSARQAAEELGLAIDSFRADVVSVMAQAQDREATYKHINQALSGLAPKLSAALEKALPVSNVATPENAIMERLDQLAEKVGKLESKQLSFAPTAARPATPPVARSIRSSPPRQVRSDGKVTVSQIVDAAANRFGRL